MPEPYWRCGTPMASNMVPAVTDLCDYCGHTRDRHSFKPVALGFPCAHPRCNCSRANGYRRCVGPRILETYTTNGVTVNIAQPAPPSRPIL